jgi:hypothetical protein
MQTIQFAMLIVWFALQREFAMLIVWFALQREKSDQPEKMAHS